MFLSFEKHLASLLAHGHIEKNAPLKELSTMRVGGMADFIVEPASEEELISVVRFAASPNIPLCLVGNGSNIVFSDDGFDGIVVHLGKAWSDVQVNGNVITAQSGALLPAVARAAYAASLSGLEFAAGIPGSVGGAVCMNAGAYGGEMKDVVTSVRVYADGKIRELSLDELDLGYRHSAVLTHGWIVLSATMTLKPGDPEAIKAAMDDYNARRREKQPLQYPSCGSFFKRPVGHYAGALIEQAGLKGYSLGGAQISALHAGFMINADNATASDIYALMLHVQKTVNEKFGVMLEPEVQLIGKFEK